MTLYQTNRAIKVLREAAKQGPLSMQLHSLIVRVLLDLLSHRDTLKLKGKK